SRPSPTHGDDVLDGPVLTERGPKCVAMPRLEAFRDALGERRVPCCTHYDSCVHEVSTRSSRLMNAFRRLRPEEGLLVIAFVASAVLTIYANVDLHQQQISSRRIRGGLLRLAVVVGLAAILPWLERTLRRRQGSRRWLATAEFLRTILPFVMCIAVYTNLHDTVRY